MKRKFLSFVLAICFILPCAFVLSACDGAGGTNLAGKTLTPINESNVYWDMEAYAYYEEKDGKSYSLSWNLEDFVENVFNAEGGKEYLSEFCYFSTKEINTLEEAKEGIEHYIATHMIDHNPKIVISGDATEATTYAYSDSLTTPLKTYSVQKDGEEIYKLFEGQDQVGEMLVTSEGVIKCYGSIFKLDSKKYVDSVPVTEYDVTIKVPQDGGTENDYIEISLAKGRGLTFMLDGFVTYKVKTIH